MGIEIEHKYIVTDDSFKEMAVNKIHISQGYLSRVPERTVRIRITDNTGFITVKGKNQGDFRLEFEYPIPYQDALKMLDLCDGTKIDKIRWIVEYEGLRWEVDEYLSPEFPTVAEVELKDSTHSYQLPPFVGREVTGDPAYYNSNIR